MTNRLKGLQMKINNFRGYKYRRYTVALRLLALAWIPYAANTFFIYPSTAAFLAALFLVAAGVAPLWILSYHTECIAQDEFARLRTVKSKQAKTLLGVVPPRK
jgi:hypothetical protein